MRQGGCCSYTTTSGKKSDPLRILFCGSDVVSTEALQALYEECKFNRELVESIDVVVQPPKPSGRGLKKLVAGEWMASPPLPLPSPLGERVCVVSTPDSFEGDTGDL